MLDDLKYIHEKDAADALGLAEHQYEQLLRKFDFEGTAPSGDIENIVYAGMGGSALAAVLLHTWPNLTKPFEVLRDYDIPGYVNEKTLFIAASYSGNTEEALSALSQAEAAGAQIAVIAGGGKLQEIAEEKGYLYTILPKAAQPRYAVLYNFRALLDILAKLGVIQESSYASELERVSEFLKNAVLPWKADVATASNPAKQLAQELIGKSIVVYGGPKLYPAAYKWKISFNENAKQVAWVGQLPEFNHNEFIGWSKQPIEKPYAVIDLRSSFENDRVQKRFVVSARLLSGMRPEPIVVEAKGEDVLEQLFYSVAFGDFVSIYLALLNGLNPAPVDLVEKFKKALDE